MTKKYKFNFYNGVGGMNDSSEIIELDENLSEKEIDGEFGEWFLNQLDMDGIGGSWEEVENEI